MEPGGVPAPPLPKAKGGLPLSSGEGADEATHNEAKGGAPSGKGAREEQQERRASAERKDAAPRQASPGGAKDGSGSAAVGTDSALHRGSEIEGRGKGKEREKDRETAQGAERAESGKAPASGMDQSSGDAPNGAASAAGDKSGDPGPAAGGAAGLALGPSSGITQGERSKRQTRTKVLPGPRGEAHGLPGSAGGVRSRYRSARGGGAHSAAGTGPTAERQERTGERHTTRKSAAGPGQRLVLQYRDSLQPHPELAKVYRELASAAAAAPRKGGSESGAPGEEAAGAGEEGQPNGGVRKDKDKGKGGAEEAGKEPNRVRWGAENESEAPRGGEGEEGAAKSGPGERGAGVAGAGPVVDVLVPREYATTTNRQVRARQLWGTDVYTDDSDLVAVLMHMGYFTPISSPPPASVSALRATLRILPPLEEYVSSSRNSMRSRAWGASKGGNSFTVESCCFVKAGGGTIALSCSHVRTPPIGLSLQPPPSAPDRTVTTRAATHGTRQQRTTPEVSIQYNLCNEPWQKFSLALVADRGLRPSSFTSARLRGGDVLYLETQSKRYELSLAEVAAGAEGSAGGQSGAPGGAEAGPAGRAGEAGAAEKQAAGAGSTPAPSALPSDEGRKSTAGAEAAEGGTKRGAPEAGAEKEAADERQGKRRKTDPAAAEAPSAPLPAANPGKAREQGPGDSQEAAGLEKGAPTDLLARKGLQRGGRPRFTWAQCIPPLPLPSMRACGVPLPQKLVKVVHENLSWSEIEWAPSGVWVRGKQYHIVRAHFLARKA